MSEERYHVWAFRKHHGCYECSATERIEVEPYASGMELNQEEFDALMRWTRGKAGEHIFLWRKVGDNAMTDTIKMYIGLGREMLENERKRDEEKKRKAAEKAARAKENAAKKAAKEADKKAEQERRLYEELKARYENLKDKQ